MSLGPVLVTAASVAACAPALQRLRDAGCELRVLSTPQPFDEAWLVEQVGDVAGLIVAMEPVGARVFAAAPQLKVIARPGVGFDTIDMAAAARHGVAVSIAAGCNDQSVADFTMGLLLAAARGLLPAAASVQAQGWARNAGTEVWSKTLALVGLGRIGQGVARRARGFDLRVLAVTRQQDAATTDFAVRHGVELVDLEEALGQADFVSLHAPLTLATAQLINPRTLALMKPGAYLINTARGGLVDEAALVDAVRSGYLAGAAVDVLQQQGAGSGSALIGVPGIIVTPHLAALSREAVQRVALSAAQSLVDVLSGRRPATLVN